MNKTIKFLTILLLILTLFNTATALEIESIGLNIIHTNNTFEIKNAYIDNLTPTPNNDDGHYKLIITDKQNNILIETKFDMPEISAIPNPEWFAENGTQIYFPDYSNIETQTLLYVDYNKDAHKAKIKDIQTDTILTEKTLSNIFTENQFYIDYTTEKIIEENSELTYDDVRLTASDEETKELLGEDAQQINSHDNLFQNYTIKQNQKFTMPSSNNNKNTFEKLDSEFENNFTPKNNDKILNNMLIIVLYACATLFIIVIIFVIIMKLRNK